MVAVQEPKSDRNALITAENKYKQLVVAAVPAYNVERTIARVVLQAKKSVDLVIVCDDGLNIKYIVLGWKDIAHDNHVLSKSKVFHHKPMYFSPIECLLGDYAFTNQNIIVAAFKTLLSEPFSMYKRHVIIYCCIFKLEISIALVF